MFRFRSVLLFAAAFALLTGVRAPVSATTLAECLADVAQADFAAKTAHQNGLRDLIVQWRPEFTDLADINRDVQLLFAEMRFARLQYLVSKAPERLDTSNGLSSFRNFNWSEEDLAQLTAASPDYRAKVERLEALKAQNNGHSDWPAMREFVRQAFAEQGPFKDLVAAFQEHNAMLEARLTDCRP